jgi:hypothetical protein
MELVMVDWRGKEYRVPICQHIKHPNGWWRLFHNDADTVYGPLLYLGILRYAASRPVHACPPVPEPMVDSRLIGGGVDVEFSQVYVETPIEFVESRPGSLFSILALDKQGWDSL